MYDFLSVLLSVSYNIPKYSYILVENLHLFYTICILNVPVDGDPIEVKYGI